MVKNFQANKATCPDGHEYLVNHQSAECPHERFVDLMVKKDRLLIGEEIKEARKRAFEKHCQIINARLKANREGTNDAPDFIDWIVEKEIAKAQDAKTASIITGKIHKDLVALQLDSPNVYEKSRRLEEYVSSMLSRILGGK